MTETRSALQIQPGRSIGWITLGSSLHGILSRLKAQPQTYPSLDLSYSAAQPVLEPVILSIPSNGLRLRFDGPDQRLRLIEVLDFSRTVMTYKNVELVRRSKGSDEPTYEHESSGQRPNFRHVYNRLFGPAYAGEYVPPADGESFGTYVLSYPGLAFSFPVKHGSWSEKADFVSLLSSSATLAATSMAIFSGSSWPESRNALFSKQPSLPRLAALASKDGESIPDEIEEVRIFGGGKLEFLRRTSLPFLIKLGETSPQDLIAELGPPDAIYRKHSNRVTVHAAANMAGRRRRSSISPAMDLQPPDPDSSTQSHTEDSDTDQPVSNELKENGESTECFYNYFQHGFDVLISYPTAASAPFPNQPGGGDSKSSKGSHIVVTKIFLHANVPGSYSFNRHRRSRWTIWTDPGTDRSPLTSEMPFSEISLALKRLWQDTYANRKEEERMQRGMVLNRGWGESPESSIELLGGMEVNLEPRQTGREGVTDSIPSLSNTELFGFEGLLFEVLKNDAVCCLTIY